MSSVHIAEFEGGWVVTAATTVGRLQRYVCQSLALAQRWATLLGAPRRSSMAPTVRPRAPEPRPNEAPVYTVTWVGPPEIAGTR